MLADVVLDDFFVAENAPSQSDFDSSMYTINKTLSENNLGADFQQPPLDSIPERSSSGASRFHFI